MVIVIIMCQQLSEAQMFDRKKQQQDNLSEMMAAGLIAQMLTENDGKHTVVHYIFHVPVYIPVRRHIASTQRDLPAYLKQLALERIGEIPIDAIQVYTDSSRDDYYRSGSGICIKSQDHNLKIQRRNPDGCSVFRSELLAIDEALGSLASLPNGKEI
ncbi:uncharacterized protein TNCT_241141, partial [Trichonephila clavata]